LFLNMNQLRSFYTAAKLGSITKAAEELFVTPSAVTLQIKQLEENIGIRLLFRAGNSMHLTDVGVIVYERARKVFEDTHNLEIFIADIIKGKSGTLKMGCSETAAIYVMPMLIKAFKHAYPGITFAVDRGPNEDMVRSLLNHRNDLIVAHYRPDEKRIKMRYMGKKEIILIAANESVMLPQIVASATELRKVPLIVPIQGSATREIVLEHLKGFEISPRIVIESSSIELTKKLVREDEGVSFLCRDTVQDDLLEGNIREIRLLECSPFIEYGVGYLNQNVLSQASLAFLRIVEKSKNLLSA
jgi:DNA-binding transcriptional LysR family regulator